MDTHPTAQFNRARQKQIPISDQYFGDTQLVSLTFIKNAKGHVTAVIHHSAHAGVRDIQGKKASGPIELADATHGTNPHNNSPGSAQSGGRAKRQFLSVSYRPVERMRMCSAGKASKPTRLLGLACA